MAIRTMIISSLSFLMQVEKAMSEILQLTKSHEKSD